MRSSAPLFSPCTLLPPPSAPSSFPSLLSHHNEAPRPPSLSDPSLCCCGRLDQLALPIFLPLHPLLSTLLPSPEISSHPLGPLPSRFSSISASCSGPPPTCCSPVSLGSLGRIGMRLIVGSILPFLSTQLNGSPIHSIHLLLTGLQTLPSTSLRSLP